MSSSVFHTLDIGEHKIRCCTAVLETIANKTELKINGLAEIENSAMVNGNITDLDRLKKLLKQVISECEKTSNITIDELIVGIGGADVKSIFSTQKTQISESSKKVSEKDIKTLSMYCQQSEVPRTQSVINEFFLNFKIDDRDNITNPINQFGDALYGDIHLITVNKNFRDTINSTIEEIGKNVSYFVTEHEASYYCVNNPEDKTFATVDIGYKNTNISIFDKSKLVYTKNIDLGGYYLISDLSNVIKLSKKEASRVLDELSSRLSEENNQENLSSYISVTNLAEKKIKVPFDIAYQIVEARMTEIAKKVIEEITKSGYYQSEENEKVLEDGVFLTGGSVNLKNFINIFMSQMDIKVQIGKVENITNFDTFISKPQYNTILGLFWAGISKSKDFQKNKSIIKGQSSGVSIIKTLLNYIDKLF